MGIKKDLADGKNGEELVKKIFENAGYSVEKNDGKTASLSDYDLSCLYDGMSSIKLMQNEDYFTIEVKNDLYAVKSGNIAIEFWNGRKKEASGIDRTLADLWVHIVPNNGMWLTSVKKLKQYIKDKSPLRTIHNGGDGNADFYLYKMSEIFPAIFTNTDYCSIQTLKLLIKKLLENE